MAISKIGTNSIDSLTSISFAASQTASSDANTLDDYEEGTFTITCTASGGGTVTLNSSYNTGRYTKIGRLVKINADIRISSVSSPQDQLQFTIPFTCASASAEQGDENKSILQHGLTRQTNQEGSFFSRISAGTAFVTLVYNTNTSHLGVNAQNLGLGANDEFHIDQWYTAT